MDPALGAFILALLAGLYRELRWHRIHGKTKSELKEVKKERDHLSNSLKPPARQMPPWNSLEDLPHESAYILQDPDKTPEKLGVLRLGRKKNKP